VSAQERVIFSGSGGQGLMLIGKLFASLAVDKFPFITFIPSYGAEVRGGTSNCRIILSEEEIASPIVEHADSVLVMNQPSAERFLPMLAEGGTAFINQSMAAVPAHLGNVVAVPATEWAQELGDIRAANMVMLGCYLGRKGYFTREDMLATIGRVFAGKGGDKAVEINRQAFLRGWDHATRPA
jgi:2-oxoglutarate ferredoxin oxidoreductase subunit gamma